MNAVSAIPDIYVSGETKGQLEAIHSEFPLPLLGSLRLLLCYSVRLADNPLRLCFWLSFAGIGTRSTEHERFLARRQYGYGVCSMRLFSRQMPFELSDYYPLPCSGSI